METRPDSETEGTRHPRWRRLSYSRIFSPLTLDIFPFKRLLLTPFSTVRWKHMLACPWWQTPNSLPVRICATLVSLFPYLYLVSCSCLSTARNTGLRHPFSLLSLIPLLFLHAARRAETKSAPLVKIHGAVSSSSCKSLLKTRCCLNACKSRLSVSGKAGLSRDFQFSDKVCLFSCCPIPCVGLLLISTVFQLRHGLENPYARHL